MSANWPATGADWTIRLLGRLDVTYDSGAPVRIPSRTAQSLLAYLALTKGREHANEALQGLFWPESDGDKQAQNLRRAIADLRKVLERALPLGSVIVTRKGHVSLNPDRVATDVERLLDLTRHCEDQTRLAEAVGLYAGPLLSPLSNDWVMGHRMELEERFGQAVEGLCGMLTEQGSVKEAINIGRAAVVAAPSREDVHIALIRGYNSAGMRVEALRQFEELERILDETWGETPSPRAREALEAAFAESQPRKHNLPEQLTSFIGREKEIEEVGELLAKTRLLTLTGSGGCGKTRLSLQVASRVLDQYRDGVWFVEFAALTDQGLVPNTVAAALGLSEQPGKAIDQTLVDYLKPKQLLLVLDNCEHLLLACAQLAEAVLRHCPSVVVLANSREGLAIGGELVYRVPSLSLPNPKEPQTPVSLSHFESVQLFVERAVQVQRAFAVTAQNAQALASVCQRLDGIPLAIELAAARLRSLSVEEINGKLDQRFRLLTGGSRTALPRQQTLRSLIDWSYDLLNEPEQALLCRLAVFSGGWTLESAEVVCAGGVVLEGELLDLLTSICDKNLVVAEQKDRVTRYRFLETVRQYARDRALESGEVEWWRDRHLAHFLSLAEEAEPHVSGLEQQAWMNRLEAEHDNLRAALEWSSSATGNSEAGLKLAGALWYFWSLRGHAREGRNWLAATLAAGIERQSASVRAKALHAAGCLALVDANTSSVWDLGQESLTIRRELGEWEGVANTLDLLGHVMCSRGDFQASLSFYHESLSIQRELGNQKKVGVALLSLSMLAFAQGDHAHARVLAEESLAIFRQHGSPPTTIAGALRWLGRIAFQQRDYAFAAALAEEGLRLSRELGHQREIAYSLDLLGLLAEHESDYPTALAVRKRSLAIWRELGNYLSIAKTLEALASVHSALRDGVRCALLWGAAERLQEEVGTIILPGYPPQPEHLIATARAAMGDDEAFDRAWQEGRELTIEQAIELALSS